ncbi:TlpA family protein disulfide reductase [Sphingomonas sp. XMGL2]|uniref:TlpA family protein disulfide reductase n=2 Tax=Sphingomonas quercus TaxID=2842451 RepID=A0ABS6BGE9_9SPHN|nr:TlpA family protein disulfide reductase [Sphingomonas quercus]
MGLMLGACDRQKQPEPQPQSQPEAAGVIDTSHRGENAPVVPFLAPDGGPATLSGFRGKPLLVNLWATWCAPCVREMPTLDRLAQARAKDFQLVVVSQDINGKAAVDPYFAKSRFVALKPYLDKQNVLMMGLNVDTLPVTIFYDAKGKEQWRVTGGMDWTSERARKLIDDALKDPGKA